MTSPDIPAHAAQCSDGGMPSGQPGTPVPEIWLSDGQRRLSTRDLLQSTWLLLAEDGRWRPAADEAAAMGVALTYLRVGVDVWPLEPGQFRRAFGLHGGGATLIRPDGEIAWRSPHLPDDPIPTLRAALAEIAVDGRAGMPGAA